MNHQEPLSSRTIEFVEQVIVDGRYVEQFQDKPEQIARQLRLDLDDATLAEIQTTDRDRLLGELYANRFTGPGSDVGRHGSIVAEKSTAGFGGAIIVGVIAGIVVAAVAALRSKKRRRPPPTEGD